eukprot:1655026-Amphidinium_carterae.1
MPSALWVKLRCPSSYFKELQCELVSTPSQFMMDVEVDCKFGCDEIAELIFDLDATVVVLVMSVAVAYRFLAHHEVEATLD